MLPLVMVVVGMSVVQLFVVVISSPHFRLSHFGVAGNCLATGLDDGRSGCSSGSSMKMLAKLIVSDPISKRRAKEAATNSSGNSSKPTDWLNETSQPSRTVGTGAERYKVSPALTSSSARSLRGRHGDSEPDRFLFRTPFRRRPGNSHRPSVPPEASPEISQEIPERR